MMFSLSFIAYLSSFYKKVRNLYMMLKNFREDPDKCISSCKATFILHAVASFCVINIYTSEIVSLNKYI